MTQVIDASVEYLTNLLKGFVYNTNSIKIDSVVDNRGLLLTIHVDTNDIRYVIGKEGRVASSIRTIMKMFGLKHATNISVKIYEDQSKYSSFKKNDLNNQE